MTLISKHVLNSIHKSCELQNNWFKCVELGNCHKYLLPHLPNAISPPDEHMLTTTILQPGMASYGKSSQTSRSVMVMCYSCFMNTKYKCFTLWAIAVVTDTLFSELLFAINCKSKARWALYHTLAFHEQLLAVTSSTLSE